MRPPSRALVGAAFALTALACESGPGLEPPGRGGAQMEGVAGSSPIGAAGTGSAGVGVGTAAPGGAGGTGAIDAGSATPGDAGASLDASDGSSSDGSVSCDARMVLCRIAPPTCAEGLVPSVSDSCYGACVPIDDCVCAGPDDCPDPDHYTCHNFRQRCGPYL